MLQATTERIHVVYAPLDPIAVRRRRCLPKANIRHLDLKRTICIGARTATDVLKWISDLGPSGEADGSLQDCLFMHDEAEVTVSQTPDES